MTKEATDHRLPLFPLGHVVATPGALEHTNHIQRQIYSIGMCAAIGAVSIPKTSRKTISPYVKAFVSCRPIRSIRETLHRLWREYHLDHHRGRSQCDDFPIAR